MLDRLTGPLLYTTSFSCYLNIKPVIVPFESLENRVWERDMLDVIVSGLDMVSAKDDSNSECNPSEPSDL